MAELIIKINGDVKSYQDALKETKKSTEALEKQLAQVAKISAVAFTGLTATIAGSVAAFRVQEQAEIRTEATIKATGKAANLTAQQIFDMASKLQGLTTVGDEAIIAGQNLLLTFRNIGEKTFPRATEVMLDMSAAMGTDLKSSAIQLGKALNDPKVGLTALSRAGITFTEEQKSIIKGMQESGDIAGAQAVILSELENQFGGVAQAAAKGTGVFIQLKNEFGDVAESIGKELLPVLTPAAEVFKDLFSFLKSNPVFVKIASRTLLVGAAMTGLTTVLALGVIGFIKIRSVIIATKLATNGLKFAVKGLMGATGFGLILAFMPEIINLIDTFFETIRNGSKDLQSDTDKVNTRLGALTETRKRVVEQLERESNPKFKKALQDQLTIIDQQIKVFEKRKAVIQENKDLDAALAESGQEQLDAQKKANEEKISEEEETLDKLINLKKNKKEAEKQAELEKKAETEAEKKALEIEATARRVQSLTDEGVLLLAVQDEMSKEEISILKRRQELKAEIVEAEKIKEEEERNLTLENLKLKNEALLEEESEFFIRRDELRQEQQEKEIELKEELQSLDEEERALLRETELQQLQSSMLTLQGIRRKFALEKVKQDRQERITFLRDEMKHGRTVALFRRSLRSEELKNARGAADELSQLQNSENERLRNIGKAAALVQIGIATQEGSIKAYTALAGIPVVGPTLGVIAAGALIAYGVERANNIRQAQRGAVVEGTGFQDTEEFLLTPGELVAPRQNFDEVVNAVADKRSADRERNEVTDETTPGAPIGGGNTLIIQVQEFLEDEAFVDGLIGKIQERNEFDNVIIQPVPV